MAEQIQQQFIIDASQALASLGSLDAGLQSLQTRLQNVSAAVANFNTAAQTSNSAFRNMGQGVRAATAGVGGLSKSAKSAGQSLASGTAQASGFRTAMNSVANATNTAGISFETFSRIIQAQVIVRGINQVRDAFINATKAAGELQEQVALIQTIATAVEVPGGSRIEVDTARISDAVRDISANLNIDQLEVAEGLYDAISNQVGDYAESIQFAGEAAEFARSTNSTLGESVDSLSAILKAFDQNVVQNRRNMDILFATIDKGRVTASELANTIGRVIVPASQLGISLEEVGAATAVLSVNGLTARESMTQLRGIMTQLTKPSKDLQKALRDAGFPSAEMALRTEGLIGTLLRLRENTDGSTAAVSRLFRRVRATQGVLGLTANQGEQFNKTFRDIAETLGLSKDAYETVTDTDFETVTKTANAFRVELSRLGDDVIEVAASWVEFLGGANNIAGVLGDLVGFITRLTPRVVAFGVAFIGASNGIRIFNAVLAATPFTQALLGAAALGVAIGELNRHFRDLEARRVRDAFDELREAEKSRVDEKLKEIAEAAVDASDAFRTGLRASLQGANQASQELLSSMDDIIPRNQAFVDSINAQIEGIVGARREVVQQLESAVDASFDRINQAQRNIGDLQDEIVKTRFDNVAEGLDDSARASAQLRRSLEVGRTAAEALAIAAQRGDEAAIQRARGLFDRSQNLAESAKQSAQNAESAGLEAQAIRAIEQSIQRRIGAERQLQGITEQRRQVLEQQAQQQAEQAQRVARQAERLQSSISLFDNEGNRLSQKAIENNRRVALSALDELEQLQLQAGELDILDSLGFADLRQRLEKELTEDTQNVRVRLENEGQALADQLTIALARFNADPMVSRLKQALDGSVNVREMIDVSDLDALAQEIKDTFNANLNVQSQEASAVVRRSSQRRLADEAASNLITDAPITDSNVLIPRGLRTQQLREDAGQLPLIDALEQFETKAQQAGIELSALIRSGADAQTLEDNFRRISGELDTFADNQGIENVRNLLNTQVLGGTLENLKEMAQSIKLIGEEEKKLKRAAEATEAMGNADFQNIINAGEQAGELESNTTGARDSTQDISRVGFGNLQGAVGTARTLKAELQAAATAAAAASAGGEGVPVRFGGFFNTGGPVGRGVDNIPAMLTQGESVNNRQSTARFFSQIQAMNANQPPVFRDRGGPVTNVGDINVNLTSTGNGSADGRQIADSLRRELRRNPGSLR